MVPNYDAIDSPHGDDMLKGMILDLFLDLDLDLEFRVAKDIVRNLALSVDNICILDLSWSLLDSLDCNLESDLDLEFIAILFVDKFKFDFVFADEIDD